MKAKKQFDPLRFLKNKNVYQNKRQTYSNHPYNPNKYYSPEVQQLLHNHYATLHFNFKSTFAKTEQQQPPPPQLVSCTICNRKFNYESHQKHIKVCQRVFMGKRKQFKSVEQRRSAQ